MLSRNGLTPERILAVAVGAAAGVVGVLWYRSRSDGGRAIGEAPHMEDPVARALREDPVLDNRSIRVTRLGSDVIELSGTVSSETESQRAVGIAQSTSGAHTVVNRLDVTEVEERLEETRSRFEEGAPELTETHHYGMRVGTGRRRQHPATDPDRNSDKVPMVTRDLEPDPTEAIETGVGGDRHDEIKPGTRSRIEASGLAAETEEPETERQD